ncbi:hypothetical protein PsAD13_02428 [Pseudovibrio sp. Ad13]|uniref:TetR/AcrR family transcriptional regulator n=1 Tax=unclassified Pseudovibrio TaxID=2627060 RepID=UPI0007B2F87D|nr:MULTISPECIES: hypothetical protein [unclassified Pseudovibrio]KZK84060.1 hypothetical protein PsAD13_02428 [Pseudovibrio sp. Ad13]KZK98928.1 hypothetical protein PsAD5_01551 [Pseudovibrio sp. Ad5]KZL25606.1 hypothetical protein PsWM33_01824 [Pseudovibrio sp. WM33]
MTQRSSLQGKITPEVLEKVFTASFELIFENGRSNLTLEAISERSGVCLEALQMQFKGDQDPVAPAMRWYIMRFSQEVRSSSALFSDLFSRMHSMLMDFAELCAAQYKMEGNLFWSTVGDIARYDPELREEYLELRSMWAEDIRSRLKNHRRELNDDVDIEALTQFFMMVFEGIIEMVKFDTPLEDVRKAIDTAMIILSKHMKKNDLERD